MGALLSKDEVSPVVGLTKTASSIVTYVSSDGNYTGKAAKAG
jgi:hypothetical protein